MSVKSALSGAWDSFLAYQTIKMVRLDDKPIALVFRILQLIIIVYVVVYSVILQGSYQEFDTGTSIGYGKVSKRRVGLTYLPCYL